MEEVLGGIKDSADDVKEFADVDAQGLKQIGEGLQGIATLEAMDGARLKVFPNLPNLQNSYKNTKNSTVKWIQKLPSNLVSNFSAFGEGLKGVLQIN